MTEYVVMPGAHYQDICDALREKTGGTKPIRSGEIPAQIEALSGDQHYDFFWEHYQDNGGDYCRAFAGSSWTDAVYHPKKDIICTTSGEYIYHNNKKITDTKVRIEVHNCTASYMFSGCSKLKTIPFIGLYGATSTSSFVGACSALQNITFDGEISTAIGFASCSHLTGASVQSIIDHLKDLTGLESLKLTFHAEVGANMTAQQKAVVTAKNWTLVY